ncbi:MAG: DUF262 domain-containing HNH endonuclease family protein [Endomicrobiaceae bacterium]|nr:DUF262 domain-containing HNH endonuclease family protein [Endomicrobiaceae bacterium]MDD3923235.1 DUF262 domain-containing HNH endonuclease family protein [Endomicrobiaceae bacterium]
MQKEILPKTSTIKDLLKIDALYEIPKYQRNYSWKKEEIDDFWEDLNDEKNNESNFLGVMVLNKKEDGKFEVIDGQQRLITITIFLAVIRDLFQKLNEEKIANRIQEYISFQDDDGEPRGFRILPSNNIKKYFENFIQNGKNNKIDAINDSEKLIKKNYNYLKKIIETSFSEKASRNKIKLLKELRDKILSSQVVEIIVQDYDDAYSFFESLNGRGLALSTSDLLKNLLFRRISEDFNNFNENKLEDQWNIVNNNIGEEKINNFIRIYWHSKYEKVADNKLYSAIKSEKITVKDYKDLVDELVKNSEYYKKITQPEKEIWNIYGSESIKKHIININSFSVKQPYSLMLSLIRKMESRDFDNLKTNEFWEVFLWIENFTFAFNLSDKRPSILEGIYSQYAQKIDKSKNKSEFKNILQSFKERILSEFPLKDDFKKNFINLSYKNNKSKYIKFILSKINYKSENELSIKESVNIEHVLPQNPDKCWKLETKNINDYVNNIGNLTLLGQEYNKKASNKCLKEKKEMYEKSELKITKELLSELKNNNYSWNESLIKERARKLANIAWENVQIDK